MTWEVAGSKIGSVEVQEVLLALEEKNKKAGTSVVVAVPSTRGTSFIGAVSLTTKSSGRGDHLGLQCPRCRRGCRRLYVIAGELACRRCGRVRTRRQRERTCRTWNTLDGVTEARVHQVLGGGVRDDRVADEVRLLLRRLREGDQARWAAILPKVEAAEEIGNGLGDVAIADIDDDLLVED